MIEKGVGECRAIHQCDARRQAESIGGDLPMWRCVSQTDEIRLKSQSLSDSVTTTHNQQVPPTTQSNYDLLYISLSKLH